MLLGLLGFPNPNPFSGDETPEAYALRLRDRVAPAVAKPPGYEPCGPKSSPLLTGTLGGKIEPETQ